MNLQTKLRITSLIFDSKIRKAQEEYKKKHQGEFDRIKMNQFVNRRLKKEINALVRFNLSNSPLGVLNQKF